MIGKVISHYKILEKLGQGGMGVVYKAHDTKLDRFVALKFLPPHLTKSHTEKERFIQEAKAASAINHPNVCVIYDLQEHDDQQFIMMEYVDGETLSDKIKSDKIDKKEAIDYAIQIADALKAAHEKGIIHRDIKSENIMITSTGQAKVMDFGLAKLKGSLKLTKISSTVGTLAYMSPEQIQGGEIDARSDIFSFGVVLYEMLSGHLPFQGEYDSAMMYSILNNAPEPIQKYYPDSPSEMIHILDRSLEKESGERYQSINDILIELKRLKRDSDKVSRKSLAELPIVTSKKKSPVSKIAIWLMAGVVGLTALLFVLFQFIGNEDEKQPFEQMQITRLTSHGKAKDAVISPDGRYIIHVMENEGKESLWLRQVATNSTVQILPPDEVSFQGLTFSNDGNYIYYTSQKFNETFPSLYRMPVLGGSSTKILEEVYGAIAFSPNNDRFAFFRVTLPIGKSMLLVADMDGSNEKVIAERVFPEGMFNSGLVWSPEGSAIIGGEFREKIKACTLVRINIDDGKESLFGSRKWRWIESIAWSGEVNDLIVSTSYLSFEKQIWGVKYPDGEARRITKDLNYYRRLSMTGDGSSLITVQSEKQSSIWIVPKGEMENARQITSGKYDGASGIAWTRDGKIVHGSRDMKLWLIDKNGSNPISLSSEGNNDYFPSVSQDGQTILFTSQPVSILELWKMDINGSHRIKIADYAGDPQISPDGKWVIYTAAHEGVFTLWKISINGGDPIRVIDTLAFGAAISPDGKRIVCFMGVDQLTIAVLPFEGGEPEFTFDLLKGLDPDSFLRWTPDGLAWAYVIDQGGVSNIWCQPLDGSPAKQLTNFKEDLIFAFDWSQDGTLACSRGEVDNDVVLIKDLK